jgi:hypothetical protein
MPLVDDVALRAALDRTTESSDVDFKGSFDATAPGDWLALLKDIAALANSGGGIVLIGVDDDGQPTGQDLAPILAVDPADLTNRIHKYTGTHFHQFEFVECQKRDSPVVALLVGSTRTPIVFTRVGTFEPTPGQQKTLFSVGTVYFRHGAKSEPGTSEDLRGFIDRQLDEIKRSWLEGITKVVEAPPGTRIAIVEPGSQPAGAGGAIPLRLTDDPNAPAYYAVPIDTTHPFRQKEIVTELNARLGGKRRVTSHDILCIRRVYEVQKEIKFCYTQNFASPRYSPAFVDWIVAEYEKDNAFFDGAKEKYDSLKNGA